MKAININPDTLTEIRLASDRETLRLAKRVLKVSLDTGMPVYFIPVIDVPGIPKNRFMSEDQFHNYFEPRGQIMDTPWFNIGAKNANQRRKSLRAGNRH